MHLKRSFSYRKNEQIRMLLIIPFCWYNQSVGTAHQKHAPLFQINVFFLLCIILVILENCILHKSMSFAVQM